MGQEEKRRVRKAKVISTDKPGTFRGAVKPTGVSSEQANTNPQQSATPKPTAVPAQAVTTPAQAAAPTLESIVSNFMKSVPSDSMDDVFWGSSISRKESAARRYFGIPSSDKVRFILDTTIFGSCKVGFALCDKGGVYLRDEHGRSGSISWKNLKSCSFTCNDTLFLIEDLQFITRSGKQLCRLMEQVQKNLS